MTRGGQSAVGVYADAFRRRATVTAQFGGTLIDHPGLVGLQQDDGRVNLLVVDDDALSLLTGLLGAEPRGVIRVLPAASGSRASLEARPRWATESLTAMVCRDLVAVPDVPLPDGVVLRPVSLEPGRADGCVDLVAVTGFYVMVSAVVIAGRIAIPNGGPPPMPALVK